MSADPFSDILRFADAETVVTGGFTAGGRWAIRFPAPDKIKFFALVKGACWLAIEGEQTPVRVETGDVLLLSAQRAFVLAGDLSTPPVAASEIFLPGRAPGAIVKVGSGDDCVQIGGHVRLDPASGRMLQDVLPPLIHVRAGAAQAAALQWLLDQLVRESATDQPGASLASAQIAQLMFVQILRAYVEMSGPVAVGWLRAVGDRKLAPALRLMHADPGRAWQLGELARAAGMSRTTFAVHFKAVAGVPPLTYLTEWRMRLAERSLRQESTPISVLARTLGYTSESAFSNAFKRITGNAPRRYRNAVRAHGPAADAVSPATASG